MTIPPKQEFSAQDASPSVLYAKQDLNSKFAEPVLADSNNILLVSSGLVPPLYDYIELSPANQPTSIVFKQGGSGGTTVSTLTITYSGSDIETVTRT